MKSFESINDVIEFAISQEQIAVDFYLNLASGRSQTAMKTIFEEFAAEEMNHKKKLQKVLEEGLTSFSTEKVNSLNISDYIAFPEINSPNDLDYETTLRIAMNREKAAFKLYLRLSEIADGPEYRDLFLFLAQEESKHKLRFEIEYDEYVLKNN